MIGGFLAAAALISTVFFPWKLTLVLAVVAAFFEPLVPLAVGMLADTLYYSSYAYAVPVFTIGGAACTAIAFIVRKRIRASIIGG